MEPEPAGHLDNHHRIASDYNPRHPRTPSLATSENCDSSRPILGSSGLVQPEATPQDAYSQMSRCPRTCSWWWWWEILAMLLSLASMGLLAYVLSKINGIPLEAWSLPIVPQSVIAILTTAGKTALLVPVASCISQLKWHHFTKPRKLIDLQLFDGASRGPWGSTLLVWHLAFRARLLVALGFAIVTVLVLGSNSDLLAIQSSIVNGATGSVFPPYFNCPPPATRCAWDKSMALGVCAEFRNVSSEAVAHCNGETYSLNCTYTVPGVHDLPTDSEGNMMVMQWIGITEVGSFVAVKAVGNGQPIDVRNATGVTVPAPPPTEVYYATFRWCARTYHNTSASQKHLNQGQATAEELLFTDYIPAKFTALGAQLAPDYYTLNSNATNTTFKITSRARISIPSYFSRLLTTTVYNKGPYAPDVPNDGLFAIGFALMSANLSDVVTNIAETLNNQIRSSNPGDNYNATTVAGEAFFQEPYIEVQWAYLALPLSVTLVSAVLLAITILMTDKQPLLKHSLVALLVNRLHGWSSEELDVQGQQTLEKLDRLADTMVARLEDDKNGRTRLVRTSLTTSVDSGH
ncbi:hypothetical protein F4808DRAFT_476002 [Astrocystis sublimbata]|nr:hypothetical protein F4808DRAFT_476002 [Astrocystis sublimbata]